MITFDNISKKFKYHFWDKEFVALDRVSFKIETGDLVGFLGANGAGKTTLIKILMDFSRQDSGSVAFDKILGSDLNEIKNNIGYLPERAYLYPHLTGAEFLNMICELHHIDQLEAEKRIKELTELLKINHALDRKINGYSKGMQQRLGFVSAIIHQPKFIVLDEPLSGLDPIGRRDFKKILKNLNINGVTIFFSSHVVSDVEEICNKVVFIESGKLIYEGSVESLLEKNATDLYQVKTIENNAMRLYLVKEDDKKNLIKGLVDKNVNILSLDKETPTLEEIIYKIKKE
jgi:ABC-2 type transport system ATP-binding protein